MLASGTVVFGGSPKIYYVNTKTITLKNVEVGMTNISKGLNVTLKMRNTNYDTKFASVEDLKKGIQLTE